MKRLCASLMLVMFLLLSVPGFAFAAAYKSYKEVVTAVDVTLQKAMEVYDNGDRAKGKKLVEDAYFGPYEGGQMEKAVRLNISSARNAKIEGLFRDIKIQIKTGAPREQIDTKVKELMTILKEDAAILDGEKEGAAGMFVSSFLIIVREGFEAILVLGAIIAYLVKSGNKERVKTIYQSALAALGASILTAVVIKLVFQVSGASQEVLEGVTMLIAVVVLFSVSFWLFSKAEAKKWKNYIEGKIKDSLSTGNTLALWFASFLAVYREGAETVLFYQALVAGSPDKLGAIGGGLLVGCLALVAIFLIVRYGSIKLPLKPFFLATGVLLYYLAFVFAGQGIAELQAGGLITSTPLDIPAVAFLGIVPTVETTALQGLLILAVVAGLLFQRLVVGTKNLNNIKA